MKERRFGIGGGLAPLHAVPSLDVEEVLEGRVWEKAALQDAQEQALRDGLEFLDKVEKGHDIIREVATQGRMTPDVVALSAYEYTRNALRSQGLPQQLGFDERHELIKKSQRVLRAILESKTAAKKLNTEDLEAARMLFESLAELSHRSLRSPARSTW